MSSLPLSLVVLVFLTSAAIGVFAAETSRQGLLAVFKPLTTALLLLVLGWPRSPWAWLVGVGIVLSLAGDVALLGASKTKFLVGLALFLIAHLAYIAGFTIATSDVASGPGTPAAGPSLSVTVAAALVMAVVTGVLLRIVWPGTAGMRPAVVAYAVTIAAMVVAACAATSAGISPLAAVGAGLFYVSDSSLAINRFWRPIKHAPLLTLGIYWLGQLGIALAARGVLG